MAARGRQYASTAVPHADNREGQRGTLGGNLENVDRRTNLWNVETELSLVNVDPEPELSPENVEPERGPEPGLERGQEQGYSRENGGPDIRVKDAQQTETPQSEELLPPRHEIHQEVRQRDERLSSILQRGDSSPETRQKEGVQL